MEDLDFRDYKHNNENSKYIQHILDNNHSIGPIQDTMKILHIIKKRKIMDTLEKYHI